MHYAETRRAESIPGHIEVLSARKAIVRFCRKILLGVRYPRHFWGRLFSSSTISWSFSTVGAGSCACPSGLHGQPRRGSVPECRGRPLCLPIRIAPVAGLKKGRHRGLPLRAAERSPRAACRARRKTRSSCAPLRHDGCRTPEFLSLMVCVDSSKNIEWIPMSSSFPAPRSRLIRRKRPNPKTVHFVFECTEPFFAHFFAFLASDRLGLQVS